MADKLTEVQQELVKNYAQLARKLGKLPTSREVRKFIASGDKVAHHFGSHSQLKEAALVHSPELEDLEVPVQLVTADIEAYRLEVEKKKNERHNKNLVKNVSNLDYIARFAEGVFKGRLDPVTPPKGKKKLTRAVSLTLSDLHFGADIQSAETGFLSYGRTQEARRFAKIIQEATLYKERYRAETELHVNLLGDIIQHKLHDAQDAAPMSEQVCRAIHLLTQGVARLAESYPRVYVHCSTGNHGRDLSRHQERATSGKWDSVETVIYYSVKQALSRYSNVVFNIPRTPFVIYEILGHKMFATHGDTVIRVGNPGKSINIKMIEEQLNRINSTLKDTDEIKVAIVGHTHCPSVSFLSSGTALVTNGALPPVDPFAVSIGILENKAAQILFEVTEDYAVGDIRFLTAGKVEDEDDSLDKLIKPWETF